jgi:hypothetical protein
MIDVQPSYCIIEQKREAKLVTVACIALHSKFQNLDIKTKE